MNDIKHVSNDRLNSIEEDARRLEKDFDTNYLAVHGVLQEAQAERRRRSR